MFITKNEISTVEYPILHDCLYEINLITPSFRSCYMDRSGELALQFNGILSDDEIRGILFSLSAIEDTPYSPAPVGPSAMQLKYGVTHHFDDERGITEVYSKDGWDYRRF